MTRIYVLSGQGGIFSSPGMAALAQRLQAYGQTTFHAERDPGVLPSIQAQKGKVAVVGYSLGANMIGWLSQHTKRPIELGVAYDPSRQSPLASNGVQRVLPTIKRVLCYYNPGAWPFGGAQLIGTQVETIPISAFHLWVQFRQDLHARTIEAIKGL